METLRGTLSPASAGCLDQIISEGAHDAAERYSRLTRHQDFSPEALAADAAAPLVDPQPGGDAAAREAGLQSRLSELADTIRVDELLQHFADTEDWVGLRRFNELRHPDCDHDWISAIHPAYGAHVPSSEFSDGLRVRLGVEFVAAEVACAACEHGMLETTCSHALRCAPGACTRGHNAVRAALSALASLADPSSSVEPLGVVPSTPNVRPADVLTTAALPGCTAALDVGVASPDSIGAGPDCCEAMMRRKLGTYSDHFHELSARGVRYVPFALSCYGRLHPEAAVTVSQLAAAAARRQGSVSARTLEKRARCWISVAVVRRAVAMVRACLPPMTAEQATVLLGSDLAAEVDLPAAAAAVVSLPPVAAMLAA